MFHNRRMLAAAVRRPFAAAGGGGGTDPPGIFGSNLKGWWDATDGLTGGTTAPDKTTPAHNLIIGGSGVTVGSGSGPVFNGGAVYNIPFSGYMSAGALGSLTIPNLGSAGAIFVAIRPSVTGTDYGRTISLASGSGGSDDSGVSTGITGYYVPSANAMGVACNNILAQGANGSTTADGNYFHCYAWDSTTEYFYSNDPANAALPIALIASAAVGATINIGTSGVALTVAANPAGGAASVAQIGFIFIVNTTPSGAQLIAAYNYYRTKYGL